MSRAAEVIRRTFGTDGDGARPIRCPKIKRERLALLFEECGFRRGVEVGVHKGYYSSVLCTVNSGLWLSCVDIWKHEEVYREAIGRLRPYRCEMIRMDSVAAAKMFEDESLDFAYIDGDHTEKGFGADLPAWERKVRIGGIVSGHDYKVSRETPAGRRCDVVKVVDQYVAKNKIEDWYVIGEAFVSWPSWLWVKGE